MLNGEEIDIVKKAVVYGLMKLFKKSPEKAYTVEELKSITDAYITGNDSQ